jgi:isoleucyl-tRNA synthetase
MLALEQARQLKTIGKALDGQLTVVGPAPLIASLDAHAETLRELLNVSRLSLVSELPKPGAGGAATEARFSVARAAGRKCERCWRWEADVASHPDHPTICGRCVKAVEQRTGS